MRAIVKTLPGLLLAAALHGAVRAQDSPVPEAVAPGVWMVQGQSALGSSANRNFISNAGFVVTTDGVVVIDALGSPALAEELLAQIRRITPLPVRHVILTHYHADHIYGLQAFKAAGATVIAHRAAGEYLNSETAVQRLKASREELFPWIDEKTRLVGADRWIDGPTTLTVGGVEFRLQPVGPSHTPEDLVVYVPALRTRALRRPGRQRPLDRSAGHAARLRHRRGRARPRAGVEERPCRPRADARLPGAPAPHDGRGGA
jgi:hypothetical protein